MAYYSIYNQKQVKNMSEKIKWIICLISGFIVDILGGGGYVAYSSAHGYGD